MRNGAVLTAPCTSPSHRAHSDSTPLPPHRCAMTTYNYTCEDDCGNAWGYIIMLSVHALRAWLQGCDLGSKNLHPKLITSSFHLTNHGCSSKPRARTLTQEGRPVVTPPLRAIRDISVAPSLPCAPGALSQVAPGQGRSRTLRKPSHSVIASRCEPTGRRPRN
eukprot:COSAG02_NODE_730_length_17978_cov_1878.016276_8_plen_163_part_00